MTAVAIWLGLAAVPALAQAQEGPEWQLTGGSSRAWVLRRFVRTPDPGDACVSGAVYTFATTHDLAVSSCQQGHVVTSHHTWSVSQAGEGGATLAITGLGTYDLRFQASRHRPRLMRLEARGATPLQPAIEGELSLDED